MAKQSEIEVGQEYTVDIERPTYRNDADRPTDGFKVPHTTGRIDGPVYATVIEKGVEREHSTRKDGVLVRISDEDYATLVASSEFADRYSQEQVVLTRRLGASRQQIENAEALRIATQKAEREEAEREFAARTEELNAPELGQFIQDQEKRTAETAQEVLDNLKWLIQEAVKAQAQITEGTVTRDHDDPQRGFRWAHKGRRPTPDGDGLFPRFDRFGTSQVERAAHDALKSIQEYNDNAITYNRIERARQIGS